MDDRRRPPRPALAWRRTVGSWTRVASRGGYQVGQPLRLKVQLDQQRERSVAEAARGASTGMHPLDYSESVPGRKPTTGRQAATSRGTSTGMHTVGCSRMCACQQCCTPLPYHKFVHTDLLLQPVCLVAMGIAWCNDVALVQRCRTAQVWIHPGGNQAGTDKQAKQKGG